MNLHGIKIKVSEEAVVSRWVFPTDPFVEFGPEDESFCKLAGYGHSVTEPGAYQVGDTLIVHPTVYAELKKFVPEPRVPPRERRTVAPLFSWF